MPSSSRKASSRSGLNEFAIKSYFSANYKSLSKSWSESLSVALQKGADDGWLRYDKGNKHYSLNMALFKLIKENGAQKAFNQYFKRSPAKKQKKPRKYTRKNTKNTNRNNNTQSLRRSKRIQSLQHSETETEHSNSSQSDIQSDHEQTSD